MTVALTAYDNTSTALECAIDLADGFKYLKPTDHVLIKPNVPWGGMGMKAAPKFGVVTTARTIEYLIILLRKFGVNNISIGEGVVLNKELASNTLKGFKWTGMTRIAQKHEVGLIDLNQGPFRRVIAEETNIDVAEAVLDCNFLINVPVLKTHAHTKVSLALKNLKGCISDRSRMRFHRKDLDTCIALLNQIVKSDLTIIDGIYALENGPDFIGRAHRTNVIIAGRDAFACDCVGAKLLGIDPETVDHLNIYAKKTNKAFDSVWQNIKGEILENSCRPLQWKMNLESIFNHSNVTGIKVQYPGKGLCSGCFIALESILLPLCKDNPGTDFNGIEFCFGDQVIADPSSNHVFLVGQCAIKANGNMHNANMIKGCPPQIGDALVPVLKRTVSRWKFSKILTARILKTIAGKTGMYHEHFPAYYQYDPDLFLRDHF